MLRKYLENRNYYFMKQFTINKNDADQRVDKFIQKAFPALQKSVMYKAIRTKNIKLNGRRCEISTRLSEGDELKIFISDDLLGKQKTEKMHVKNNGKSLSNSDIIYEDENIILINKKPGIIVHSDSRIDNDTLADRLKNYLSRTGEYNPDEENSFAPALCNRLDRNTAGIVIGAKNAAALREINSQIREDKIVKKYLCLLVSAPAEPKGTLTAWHHKDNASNTVVIKKDEFEGSKKIITKYRVVDNNYNNAVLTEIELVTGRTHQIRAHMAFIGCPVAGDTKYGNREINEKFGFRYQALCAYRLFFRKTDEPNILSYLEGREFENRDIWFLSE